MRHSCDSPSKGCGGSHCRISVSAGIRWFAKADRQEKPAGTGKGLSAGPCRHSAAKDGRERQNCHFSEKQILRERVTDHVRIAFEVTGVQT